MQGRPLRFLGAVLAGWTGLRVAMLWPAATPIPLAAAPARATVRRALGQRPEELAAGIGLDKPKAGNRSPEPHRAPPRDVPALVGAAVQTPLASIPPIASGEAGRPREQIVAQPVAQLAADSVGHRPRLAGDAWLVLRPSGGDNLAFGQLGGSQGGARLTYALEDEHRLELSARVSAPVRGRGAEAAVGLDLRPTALPAHLLIEERVGLDGGGARPAAGVIAGASAALPFGARLDAYGQAGAVWRRGGFADGAAILVRPVLERRGARVEIGGGAWGAAQRRTSRLDLGPSAALIVPTSGATLRLQLDWRARVIGNARPGSGPALSLGGSF